MPTLERTYPATPAEVWELWTTPAGIERWWAPDGFTVEVESLELEPGGELVYSLTAVAPEMVAFLEREGIPLRTVARKRFTAIEPHTRLAYDSHVDYAPGVEPYEQATTVDLTPTADGVHVVMTMEPMHDEEWTHRLVAGRANELDNLARLLAR